MVDLIHGCHVGLIPKRPMTIPYALQIFDHAQGHIRLRPGYVEEERSHSNTLQSSVVTCCRFASLITFQQCEQSRTKSHSQH